MMGESCVMCMPQKIFEITTSFLGRGHQKYDVVRRLLWTAPKNVNHNVSHILDIIRNFKKFPSEF